MVETMKKNFEKNAMELIFVSSSKEAFEIGKTYIKPGMSVGLGGSTTVVEIGLLDFLINKEDIKLFNQYEKGIDMDKNLKRRREGLLSDIYITGTNALSLNGELINADGSGNRVASQIFGPKKLLIFTGINKIVKNVEEGFKRIREIAMVKNIERINKIAIKNAKKPIYNENNIANKFSYINGDVAGRTTIILINENLGF